MIKIKSFGAAGEVTGSRHLIEINDQKILLDCGMFQGPKEFVSNKNEDLGFDATQIDAVILSHGHLDHCGSLPTLVLKGFNGRIFSSEATRDVARLIMEDSAEIQFEDAKWKNRHFRDGVDYQPLYTKEDVEKVVEKFSVHKLHESIPVIPGVELRLYEAGHILGSTLLHLTILDEDKTVTIGYTGDLGQKDLPILNAPERLPETEILICESTYGDRLHDQVGEREQKLIESINKIMQTGGKIIIPSFALGRLQTLVYTLHKLQLENLIPRLPIYVDSPLGSSITEVFESYTELYDSETRKLFSEKKIDPFGFNKLTYIKSVEESKGLNHIDGPCIIISSSGMAEAGRVVHHLKHNLSDPKNIILVVGYMADQTLGRKILNRESPVEILHESVPINAEVTHIDAFSAHADKNELLDFIIHTPGVRELYLVHGDDNSRRALAQSVNEKNSHINIHFPKLDKR
jgi:metallo-beta-lactamase family protein